MENLENICKFLELLDQPAFFARDARIAAANRAAENRGILTDSPLAPLLEPSADALETLRAGTISLPVCIGGAGCTACAERIGGGILFLLEAGHEDRELRALALAAQQLRLPLNQAMTAAETLRACGTGADADRLAAMNRSLYQMLRIVLNMSDSHQSTAPRMELCDLSAVFQEIFDRSAQLCAEVGVHLQFVNWPRSIYSLADSGRLERAVYNLLSNALKHTESGTVIEASLTQRGNRVYLTVTDPGGGAPPTAGAFSRFLREPGLEDSRSGLGLGMRLVQAAASAHGGTVLMEPLPGGGMRVTLSLAIRQGDSGLHEQVLRIDYAGELDHALIEFSDLLPDRLYGR